MLKTFLFSLLLCAPAFAAGWRVDGVPVVPAGISQRTVTVSASSDGTNTIAVLPSAPIYRLTVTNDAASVSFDLSALDLTSQCATWETWITGATNVVLSLPGTNLVYYVADPELPFTAEGQTHYAVWRASVSGGTTNIFCHQWLTY